MKTAPLYDVVARQLEDMIESRRLRPGDRLPAERQLAQELGVSRSSVREAIQKLASRGRLASRPGGGTFVQAPPAAARPTWDASAITAPLLPVVLDDPAYRYDVLEIRHALEATSAWLAAQRATDAERARIRAGFETMAGLHGGNDPAAEARADAAFHIAIAEASHNLVLIHVMHGLFALLQANVSQNREKLYTLPRVAEPLLAQHRALLEAIEAGDAERAREAARAHIDFVHDSLHRIDQDEARRARSSRLPAPGS